VAGSVSGALAVALDLRDGGADLVQLAQNVGKTERLSREKVWSDLGGGYLGPAPEDALQTFMDFAQRAATLIRT
jgi:hypothetical protein